MGSTARYACVCGATGSREAIARHIAESEPNAIDEGAIVRSRLDTDDGFGGDTMAHYLPAEPRRPAPPTPAPPTFPEADPPSIPELPPPPNLFEVPRPSAIAELFQDMLRTAYQAGVASATSGETFENWYQREVLQ